MVLLAAAGTAAAIKLTQRDVARVEQYTGTSAEDLTEEELLDAMEKLGIQKLELTPEDQAAIGAETGDTTAYAPPPPQPAPPAAPEEFYLDELERLADLRDREIITDEDFEAKKRQLLGL